MHTTMNNKSLKRNITRLVMIIVALAAPSLAAFASDYVAGNGIAYDLNPQLLTATVTYKSSSYNSYSGAVTIPASITANDGKSYRVTAVGDNAFRYCSNLSKVTLGPNVERLGKRAFLECTALKEIDITAAVTSVGDYAFAQCPALNKVTMHNTHPLEVGTGAFMQCTSLAQVQWVAGNDLDGTGGMTSLGTRAFADCSALEQIVLPANLESLGNSIFAGCQSLTKLTVMRDAPLALMGDPFELGTSQVTIMVPRGVMPGAVAQAYSNANGWRDYAIAELSYSMIDAQNFTYCKTSGNTVALTGCLTAKSVVNVRPGVTTCDGKHYQVASIAGGAFKSSGVTTLNTANATSLTSIGDEAFAQAFTLNEVTLNEGLISIGEAAFRGCTALTAISLPSTLVSLEQSVMEGCTHLRQVEVTHGLRHIATRAFALCTSLNSITLPRSVARVEPHAFVGASSLQAINVVEGSLYYASADGVLIELVNDVERPSLQGSMIAVAIYPMGKTTEIFYCPAGVTTLWAHAFEGASHLKTLTLPATVEEMGEGCFAGTNLARINYRAAVPATVDASVLSAINKSTVQLQVPIGATEAYREASVWKDFASIVERNNVVHNPDFTFDWDSYNNVILIDIEPQAVSAVGVLDLPQGVTLSGVQYKLTSIKNTSTGSVARLVKTININSQLQHIDTSEGINPLAAFTELTAITLSEANTAFVLQDDVLTSRNGARLYYYLRTKGNASYTLDSRVDSIMPQAFAGNVNLQKLVSNSRLRVIGDGAFEGCTSLCRVDNAITVLTIGNRAFRNSGIDTFNGGDRLITIGNETFEGCSALTSFPLSHGALNRVGARTFKGCSSLTVAMLGKNVNSLGDEAFEGCTSLQKVFFASHVSNFGHRVFKNCPTLQQLWLSNEQPPLVDNDSFEGVAMATIMLRVPEQAVDDYKAHPLWKNFGNINPSHYVSNGADINGDKVVNSADITLLYRWILGYYSSGPANQFDVNQDGAVNAADITVIYKHIMGELKIILSFSFVNQDGGAMGTVLPLSGTHPVFSAIDQHTDQPVASGFSAVVDNQRVLQAISSSSGGVQSIEIAPQSQGYATIVLMVEKNGVAHYRQYPIKVVN